MASVKLEDEIAQLLETAFPKGSRLYDFARLSLGLDGSEAISRTKAGAFLKKQEDAGKYAASEDDYAAQYYPYYRERCRQLFNAMIEDIHATIRRKRMQFNILHNACLVAQSLAPAMPERVSLGLYNAGLTKTQAFPVFTVSMLGEHIINFPFSAYVRSIKNQTYWVRREEPDAPIDLTSSARAAVSREGACSLDYLARMLFRDADQDSLPQVVQERMHENKKLFVRDVLSLTRELTWLDGEENWFTIKDVPRNRLATKIAQIFVATREIREDTFIRAVDRSYKAFNGEFRVIPDEIVVELACALFDATRYKDDDGVAYIGRSRRLAESYVHPDTAALIQFIRAHPNATDEEAREELVGKQGRMTEAALAQRIHNTAGVIKPARGALGLLSRTTLLN